MSSLPRLIRNLALACRKPVQLEVEGHEKSSARTLIQAMKEPLTHLVRNALDHRIGPLAAHVTNGSPSRVE